ncbi:hypothetical protein M9401_00240 [Blochmannia endosymbiont of Camponotus sp.]|nr:hypothetical protein [Blochmannia endosymbiont of Camponotus sp.]URJ25781.1 hypothetical protein M9401_00240 [Blochmannia endosymbiont of Camponotus sp.]
MVQIRPPQPYQVVWLYLYGNNTYCVVISAWYCSLRIIENMLMLGKVT